MIKKFTHMDWINGIVIMEVYSRQKRLGGNGN